MTIDRRSFVGQLVFGLGEFLGINSRASGSPVPSAGTPNTSTQTKSAKESSKPGQLGGYIRPGTIEVVHKKSELVVVGGGISGTCAAISAARNGVQVVLVHERSTLGGNSSSEVRLFPEDTCSFSTWIKEGGILEEITAEERVRNWEPHIEGLMNSHWDLVLYEWVRREKNLSLFLNTTMREVEMADPAHILAIHAAQLGTEKGFIFEAPFFIDATGDGVLIHRSGADFRWGKEARSEYHELLAPAQASDALMGNTLFFRARDTGKPITFTRPDWAAEFNTETDLTARNHGFIEGGYWWIEVGFPMHPIRDNEAIRDEALRQLLGVWDHIKNHCTHGDVRKRAENYALEFVGFWPYKRESRRMLGDYILKEEDVRSPSAHGDDIAYGTWGIDIHVPGGILKRHVPPYPPPTTDTNFPQRGTIPYGIPLRSCYSRNVRNLLAAGRPISASYVAFASSRVLPTGAIVGQGVGAAAALCLKHRREPRELSKSHAGELQQLLLRQDASIPGVENQDPQDLARRARVTSTSEAPLKFPASAGFHPARFPLAQLFPMATNQLESVELLLKSEIAKPVEIKLGLRKASHVWDFRSTGDVTTATAIVPAKYKGHVKFLFRVTTEPGTLYYIHMPAQEGISWGLFNEGQTEPTRIPAGTTAADLPGGRQWRPMTYGKSFCLRLTPEQRPYGPQNVVQGTNRPDRWTNLYMSDPAQLLPSSLELQLPRQAHFNQIQITFDTDCNRRHRQPLFRAAECVKRYDIAVATAKGWKTIIRQDGNYFRRRVHNFDRVRSDRVRITFHETNGAKEIRVYEVRIYNET